MHPVAKDGYLKTWKKVKRAVFKWNTVLTFDNSNYVLLERVTLNLPLRLEENVVRD